VQVLHEQTDDAAPVHVLSLMPANHRHALLETALDFWAAGAAQPPVFETITLDEPDDGNDPVYGVTLSELAVTGMHGSQRLPMLILNPHSGDAGLEDLQRRCGLPAWDTRTLPPADDQWRVRFDIGSRSLEGIAHIDAEGFDDQELFRASGQVELLDHWWDLKLISFGESAVTNQCAGDAGEGQEVLGLALVATMQSAASGQPGHGELDLPPVPAQPLRGLHTLAGQAVDDSSFSEPAAQVVVVITLVSVQLGGPAPPRPAARPDRRDPADQGLQGLAVVGVGPRDRHGQGQTGPVGDQVDLRALLAPVDRIRTRQLPPLRARMLTESIAHRDQSTSPRAPSSSRTSRCSLAQTLALVHSVKRRCAVGPDGPNTGGSCAQVHPLVATKMIAASTSRSPCLRRPPPWGRVGASGTTRWNSSHSSSGTRRSTIDTRPGYRESK
jgi:hypothetical protein